MNNDRSFVVETCKTEQLKQSFFVKTVVEWNQLDTEVVRAETVESFRAALTRTVLLDNAALSPWCITL